MQALAVVLSLSALIATGCGTASQPSHSILATPLSNFLSPTSQGIVAAVATALPRKFQATPQESLTLAGPAELATRQALLDKTGKSGPPLPGSNVTPQAGSTLSPSNQTNPPNQGSPVSLAASQSTPTPQAGVATALPARTAQATPQKNPPTLSPAELATRDAILGKSGRPGPPLPNSNQPNASGHGLSCFSAVGMILLLAFAGFVVWLREP